MTITSSIAVIFCSSWRRQILLVATEASILETHLSVSEYSRSNDFVFFIWWESILLQLMNQFFIKKKTSMLVIHCNRINALKCDMEFLKYCYVNIFSREKLNYSTQSSVRRISTEIALYNGISIHTYGISS